MLSKEDMAALTAAEEKRLGVNSPEFIRRHRYGILSIQNNGKRYVLRGGRIGVKSKIKGNEE